MPNILYVVVGLGVIALGILRKKTKKIKGFQYFAKQSIENSKRKANSRNLY